MAKETRRLGRGLSSLIRATANPEQPTEVSEATEAETTTAPVQAAPPDVPPTGPLGAVIDEDSRREQAESHTVHDSASENPATVAPHPDRPLVPLSAEPTRREHRLAVESDPISANFDQGSAHTDGNTADSDQCVLPVLALVPHPSQPRRNFRAETIGALAASIAQSGVVQPLVVRPLPDAENQSQAIVQYEIIAGERRWRAAKAAGLDNVPVVVREVSDDQALEIALVENIQREDLNAIDRAQAYRAYCDNFHLTADQVARRLGEDRTTVTNFLRILDLPETVRDLVAGGALSMGHARALLGVPDEESRVELARATVTNELSVRALEDIVRRRKATRAEPDPTAGQSKATKSAHVTDLENRLQEAVGTRVSIKESRRKGHGRIVIEYYSLDDFGRIATKLGLPDGS